MDREFKLIGREDLLQKYYDAWTNGCRIFGFYGMTKVGKTRLCAEFLKLLKDTDDYKIQNWLFDFREIEMYEDFEELLFHQFDIKTKKLTVGREQILDYIKKNRDTKYIFVFDSLEEAMPKAMKNGSEPDRFEESTWDKLYKHIVIRFLSGCDNVYFCLTSCTWAKFAAWSTKAHLQAIPPLSKDHSLLLLNEVLPKEMEDDSCLETIADLCDGLPGSIVNVGTDITLHKDELTKEDIVSILIERKLEALSGEFLPSSVKIADSVNGMIRKLSDEKKNNLKVFAARGPGMSVAAGTQAFDYDKEALFKFDVVIPLKYRSLVEANRKSNDISVHPVTHEFMKLYHASTTTKDKAIAKKVQTLIQQYCEKVDPDNEKPKDYINELKDYCSQGFPEKFVPFEKPDPVDHSSSENLTYNRQCDQGNFRATQCTPRLNDLSPATSTEKEEKGGFVFPSNTNLHATLEQKPSLRKDVAYSDMLDSVRKKSLTSENELVSKQLKNLNDCKMNLGCSIEENDRVSIAPERRLSEIVKRNNLCRSLSAQENFSETKANNLSRAMTVQENSSHLQLKRSNFNRSDAIEDISDVRWDDCCGSSQNISSLDQSSLSNMLSDESNNSSIERNDTISLDDNLNVPEPNKLNLENINKLPMLNDGIDKSATCEVQSIEKDIKPNPDDLPIVRPKTTSLSYRQDDNSLKRLLFSQLSEPSSGPESLNNDSCDNNSLKRLLFSQLSLSSCTQESCNETCEKEKEPVENSCSFGPSLNPASFFDSYKSETCPKTFDCAPLNLNSLCDIDNEKSVSNLQSGDMKQKIELPIFSLLSLQSMLNSQPSESSDDSLQAAATPISQSSLPVNAQPSVSSDDSLQAVASPISQSSPPVNAQPSESSDDSLQAAATPISQSSLPVNAPMKRTTKVPNRAEKLKLVMKKSERRS